MSDIDPFARKQAWRFRGKGPNGRNICHCGCGREVAPPRRTSFSDECVRLWRERNDPGTIREIVKKRDKEICASCGLDTRRESIIARDTCALWLWLARRHFGDLFLRGELFDADGKLEIAWGGVSDHAHRAVREQMAERNWDNEHWWEADHIVPVVEGGGGCGPEGYRTLCLPCHRRETAALAARRAAQRRRAKQPEFQI